MIQLDSKTVRVGMIGYSFCDPIVDGYYEWKRFVWIDQAHWDMVMGVDYTKLMVTPMGTP